MKLKNILKLSQLAILSGLMLTACNLNEDNSKSNAAYMDEAANNKPIISLTLDVDGGMAYVFPRLANLGSCNTNLVVGLDKESLKRFNESNNSVYQPIESSDFEFILPDGSSVKGDANVSIEEGSVGAPIGIKVNKLDEEKYPSNVKLAIPVSIKSTSGVDLLQSAKSVIITVNRPVITSVAKVSNGGIVISPYKSFEDAEEWTMQFMVNYSSLTRGNLTTCYFSNGAGGELYTRINATQGVQIKNGRDGDDTWTQKPLKARKWMQISFVYKDQSVSVYVNGELQKTFLTTKLSPKQEKSITIGNGGYRDDYIREFRFFNKALTDTEILENVYQPLSYDTPNLEVYIPFTRETEINDVLDKGTEVELQNSTRIEWVDNVKFPSEELVIVE